MAPSGAIDNDGKTRKVGSLQQDSIEPHKHTIMTVVAGNARTGSSVTHYFIAQQGNLPDVKSRHAESPRLVHDYVSLAERKGICFDVSKEDGIRRSRMSPNGFS